MWMSSCLRKHSHHLTRFLSSLGASVSLSLQSTIMPTSQGCCGIKGMIAIGHSQPPGTKTLSNCKMFGSASPACGKRAPTDLKESIIYRRGEAHWASRAYYLHYHCPKVQRTERATKKLRNCGHTKTSQGLTNGPRKKI